MSFLKPVREKWDEFRARVAESWGRLVKRYPMLAYLPRADVLACLFALICLAWLGAVKGAVIVVNILVTFALFLIITLSLNLEVGLTGVPQFGRVLAVIAGAFIVGGLAGRLVALMFGMEAGLYYAHHMHNYRVVDAINRILEHNVALSIGIFIVYLILAALSGAAFGWLTSRPAIRLREAYLGISLLAFGDVMMWIGNNWWPLVGGTNAVHIPDPFRWAGDYRFYVITVVILVIAMGVFVFVETLSRSPFGRTLRMMRDCELAAQVYGRDIVRVRTLSLVVGSTIAAIGGALYAVYVGTCTAMSYTRLTWTFWPWAYMMLGGIGSNVGVVLGVLVFTIIRTLISIYRFELKYLPGWPPWLDPVYLEYTFCGLALILIVLFRPYGLVPEKPVSTLPREQIEEMLKKARERVKSS